MDQRHYAKFQILAQSEDIFNEKKIYVMKNVDNNQIFLSFDKKGNICNHTQQESEFLTHFNSFGRLCTKCKDDEYQKNYCISETKIGTEIKTNSSRTQTNRDPKIPLSQILAKFSTKDRSVKNGLYLISIYCNAGFGDYALGKVIASILVSKGGVDPNNILLYYHLENLEEELDFSYSSDISILKSKYDYILDTLKETNIPLSNVSIGALSKNSIPEIKQRGAVWKKYEKNYEKYIENLTLYTKDSDKMSIQLVTMIGSVSPNIFISEAALRPQYMNGNFIGNQHVKTSFGLFNFSLGIPFNMQILLSKEETDRLIKTVDPNGVAPLEKTYFYYPSYGTEESKTLIYLLNVIEKGTKTIITPRLIGNKDTRNTILSLFDLNQDDAPTYASAFDHRLDVLVNKNGKGVVKMTSTSRSKNTQVHEIYVVCMGNLSNLEFKSLMGNTTENIAYVGGDGSFADALSVNKFPSLEIGVKNGLGEGMVKYAMSFDEDFENLKYLTHSALDDENMYPKSFDYDEDEFVRINLRRRDLLKDLATRFLAELLPKIKKNMNMNKNLLRLLNRQFKAKKGEINEKYDIDNVLLSQ